MAVSYTHLDVYKRQVLDHAYDFVDYISMHQYYGNQEDDTPNFLANTMDMDHFIENIIATCDYIQAKKRSKKKINIPFDEWNVWYHAFPENEKAVKCQEGPSFNEDIYNFEDALLVGGMLISLLRHANRVKAVSYTHLDVYKRQTEGSQAPVWSAGFPFHRLTKVYFCLPGG